MPSITYNQIKSRFLSKIEDYKFLTEYEDFSNEFIKEWLRSTLAKPKVRRIFDALSIDEEMDNFDFEIKYPVDDFSDAEYVIDILAYGIAKPLVYMLLSAFSLNLKDNIAMLLGSLIFIALNYISQRFIVFKKSN